MAQAVVITKNGPFRLLIGSFAGLIVVGAALLALPACQAGHPVGLLDCLFTSVSAVCVTGLITVDTATAWSHWGRLVIGVLIQLGGMGIMTFSVALLHLAGLRPGLRSRLALRDSLGPMPTHQLRGMLWDVVMYTAVIEFIGAALLFARFVLDFPPLHAAQLALFHSVSAFCNAGFSLFSNSLEGYATDPLVNIVVMSLIFLGGIGFVVLRQLRMRLFTHGTRLPRLPLGARMALYTSLVLIVGGALAIGLAELAAEGGPDIDKHPWQFLFCSVTARTAGFNTIDLALLSNASVLVLIVLMFIGASPGSTGGGVKTTVMATLWALARSRLRGRPTVECLGRTIGEGQVSQALALVLMFLATLLVAMLILLSEGLAVPLLGHQRGDFLVLCFEAVSALATVGLSLGATPMLTVTGKLVIIALMFIGRLGPLTLIYALALSPRPRSFALVQEEITLG